MLIQIPFLNNNNNDDNVDNDLNWKDDDDNWTNNHSNNYNSEDLSGGGPIILPESSSLEEVDKGDCAFPNSPRCGLTTVTTNDGTVIKCSVPSSVLCRMAQGNMPSSPAISLKNTLNIP